MNKNALLVALKAFRARNSEEAYLEVRNSLIQRLIKTPDGLALVREAFPDVDLNTLLEVPSFESAPTLH